MSAMTRLTFRAVGTSLAVLNGYLALLTAVAVKDRRWARPAQTPVRGDHLRFAILVPAHDEALVISETLESFRRQRYPPELFSVHVVADNCSDGTADIARRHGADVHVRTDLVSPGKGPALGWLFERMLERGDEFDAVVIVDADTTMSPGFLVAADDGLVAGCDALQAYYSVREPGSSTSAALRFAALALRHYVRPLGRTGIGGSCGLFGNGMVFRTRVMREHRFSAHLVEDVEFQLDLLLDGTLVGFVPDAVVEAEMPATLEAARTQNERWELGRLQVARRYVPRLIGRCLQRRRPHRTAYVDAVLDQLVPPLSVLAVSTGLMTASTLAVHAIAPRLAGRATARLAVLSSAALTFHVVAGLTIARTPMTVVRSLVHVPAHILWKVTLWARVARRPADVTWERTRRNDETDLGDGVQP